MNHIQCFRYFFRVFSTIHSHFTKPRDFLLKQSSQPSQPVESNPVQCIVQSIVQSTKPSSSLLLLLLLFSSVRNETCFYFSLFHSMCTVSCLTRKKLTTHTRLSGPLRITTLSQSQSEYLL